MVDWAATGQMLSGIGTLSGSVAIIVAAILGRRAVQDFRGQKIAEKQIEHAERTLALAYKLQDALSGIRSPLSTPHELSESENELKERDILEALDRQEAQRYIQGNVFYRRCRDVDAIYQDAIEMMPFAKAHFGDKVAESLRKLIRARNTVRIYADAYMRDRGEDREFSRKIGDMIWEGHGKPTDSDELTKETGDSVVAIEIILLPIIRSEGRK